jgi:hypothetical protein
MTKRLRQAIESVIDMSIDDPNLEELESAYQEHRDSWTLTMQRIEFLENCLQDGMNKREAARALVEHDPRIAVGTAENLVYTSFSGMYQNPRRRRRSSAEIDPPAFIPQKTPHSVFAEEDLL